MTLEASREILRRASAIGLAHRPAAVDGRAAPTPELVLGQALRSVLVDTYGRVRADWPRARTLASQAQRAHSRRLSSSARRLLGEMIFFLVRNDRLLELLLRRSGLDSGCGRESHTRALTLAAAVVGWGVPPEAVARLWQGPPIEWDRVADPEHTLLGWIVEERPEPWQTLGGVFSLPDWLAQTLWEQDGQAGLDPGWLVDLAASLGRRAPLCLRVQRGRGDRQVLIEAMRQRGLPAEACRWSPLGIRLGRSVDVHSLPEMQAGLVEVQDEGSQLVAELVAPESAALVVDACAGAGGKTLALAGWMDGGRIVACDVRRAALREARKRFRRAGLQSVQTIELSESGPLPESLGDRVGTVGRVLVDAPCTGSGALRRSPQARWHTSPLDLVRMPEIQGAILDRFAPLVAPGGRLIYATCSILAAENGEVVREFLRRHPMFAILPVSDVLGSERAEQLGDGRVLSLYPHVHDTDGFYAAVLSREG